MTTQNFPYVDRDKAGKSALMPYLPVELSNDGNATEVLALVDSGSTLNVLSNEAGLALGLDWSRQLIPVRLAGNLSSAEAYGVVLHARVHGFDPVRLAFAWTANPNVPTILGQTNFFAEFDVAFFRSQSLFTVSKPNDGSPGTPPTDPASDG